MSADILDFAGRNTNRITTSSLPETASQVHVVIELPHAPLIEANKIGDNPYARSFFEVLKNTRILYILQKEKGDIREDDILYVLTQPLEDELKVDNIRHELDVRAFVGYLSEDDSGDIGEILERFCTKHKVMRYEGDGDEADVPILPVPISRIAYFRPECRLMVDGMSDKPYDSQIMTGNTGLWVVPENFDLHNNPNLTLLSLMIHASEVLTERGISQEEPVSILYVGGSESLALVFSFQEFLDEIDKAIERAYPNVHILHRTPSARRKQLSLFIVGPVLDPKCLGGKGDFGDGV